MRVILNYRRTVQSFLLVEERICVERRHIMDMLIPRGKHDQLSVLLVHQSICSSLVNRQIRSRFTVAVCKQCSLLGVGLMLI